MAKKKTKATTTIVKAKKGSKITPQEVKTFLSLYNTYGTYKAVADLTGRSADRVGYHIKLAIAAGVSADVEEDKKEEDTKGKKTITITI